MSNFIHLHTHSCYSPQDGAQSPEQIAKKASKLGMNAAALTDHGRAGGLLAFKKACEKHNVKPIYGTEAYVAPKERFLKEKVEGFKPSYHLVLLAKNAEGLKNIFKLSSIGWRDGFYYKPRIDMEMVKKHSEGIVCLSACGSGRVAQMILEDRISDAKAHAKELHTIFGEDFYLEVQNHGLDWQQDLKTKLFQLAEEENYNTVATQDAHYQEQEDSVMHSAICKLAAGDLQFDSDQSFYKSEDEMKEMFNSDEWHAILRTQEVADKCNCDWEFGETIWPIYDLPADKSPDQALMDNAKVGFDKLFPNATDEYKERLEYELQIIQKMGFATYFLVVADFINWAKNNDIPVGPGRGSGAGSLVCYCISITNVDPIKYGLYFERFLNPARISLPDIDVDFCPLGRKTVIQYVYEKYGPEKCAQIGTYASFKPRGSLRDFARVLGHPIQVGDQLSKLIPPDVSGVAMKFDEIIKSVRELRDTPYDDVLKIARKAEGLISQAGVHAAGVVISNTELAKQIPLFKGKHDEIATQLDMHEVEEIGLVKYDFLGLKNLTVIHDTIKFVKEYQNIDIDIDEIDEFDERVFNDVFQSGRLEGIFQFETSSGFRDLCLKIKPKSIEDLSAITALFRPGPLTAKNEEGKSLVEQYIDGSNGEPIKYLFPELEPILKDTYGVMVYQEQVMRICTDCAGYSLAEADNMRKIIGKKLPEKMALEKEKLINGCIKNGIDKIKAEKLFENIEGFAAYSFNKAHSVAYSIISYQTAWLKAYHKREFYCALMNNSLKDQDDLVKYIHAIREDEISISPPDINLSNAGFTLSSGTIVFGLAGVKGLGVKACNHIVEARPERGYTSIADLVANKINKGSISALAQCGALEDLSDLAREQVVANIESLVVYYQKQNKYEERKEKIKQREKEISIWEKLNEGPKPRKLPGINEKHIPVFPDIENNVGTKEDKLTAERKTLGFFLTGHPMDSFPGLSQMAEYTVNDVKEGKPDNKEKFSLPAVVSSIIEKRTRKGQNMGILIIEDKTGRIETTIFPRQWRKIKSVLREGEVYIIKCTARVESIIDSESRMVNLILDNAYIVDEDMELMNMQPIKVVLDDKTLVTFVPQEEQNYSKWQQAVAYAANMKRMG